MRRPLEMQTHKAIPIPQYAPKFDVEYSRGKRVDPDAERNEAAKLKAMYKKERKGAIRELRKDAKFLAVERNKEQKQKDADYEKRMRSVVGSITTTERAEEKAAERSVAGRYESLMITRFGTDLFDRYSNYAFPEKSRGTSDVVGAIRWGLVVYLLVISCFITVSSVLAYCMNYSYQVKVPPFSSFPIEFSTSRDDFRYLPFQKLGGGVERKSRLDQQSNR